MSTRRMQYSGARHQIAISLMGLVIGSSAWGQNPQKPIEVRIEVDNFAAAYTGDGAGTLATLASLGPMTSGPGGGIAIYPGAVTMMEPYVYIAAWSDDSVQQGLLAEVRTLKSLSSSVLSGQTNNWEVFATGINLGVGSTAPSLQEISQQIGIANSGGGCSNGWQPISVGLRNNWPVCNPWGAVPAGSINAGARWMWYNDVNDNAGNGPHVEIAGCGINPPDVPFYSGHNHCEYLIFRTKLPCVNRWGDMIAWWPFNESSGPIAEDIVGNHKGYHQAAPNDPSPVCPGCGDGLDLDFDGDDSVLVPHKADLNFMANVRTIEATVRTIAPVGFMQTIVSKGGGTSIAEYTFGVAAGSGAPFFSAIDTVAQLGFYVEGNAPVGDGWCSCVAVTFEGQDGNVLVSFYVDGIPVGSNTLPAFAAGIANTEPLIIGNGGFGGLVGELDNVTLYNRALSAEELLNNCVRKKCPCRPCRMLSPVYADLSPCGEGDGVIDLDDLLILLDSFAGNDSCPEE